MKKDVLNFEKYASDSICRKTQNASFHRRMQCESRSCFAPEQLRECTTVHDRSSAVARHEIDHNAPPPEIFLLNKWDNNFIYLYLPVSGIEPKNNAVDSSAEIPDKSAL